LTQNLEFQLKALEQRLHGREIEFVRAIEKSQEAYFQERMKLVSGHQQVSITFFLQHYFQRMFAGAARERFTIASNSKRIEQYLGNLVPIAKYFRFI
jgi:hypothetical protein